MTEGEIIIKLRKDNTIIIPEKFIKLWKLKEGDFFIVESPKWNNILLKKGIFIEK